MKPRESSLEKSMRPEKNIILHFYLDAISLSFDKVMQISSTRFHHLRSINGYMRPGWGSARNETKKLEDIRVNFPGDGYVPYLDCVDDTTTGIYICQNIKLYT